LASSRCPRIDWLPGFSTPEGAIATEAPAITIESGCCVVVSTPSLAGIQALAPQAMVKCWSLTGM
jgi:hypothetical protein